MVIQSDITSSDEESGGWRLKGCNLCNAEQLIFNSIMFRIFIQTN